MCGLPVDINQNVGGWVFLLKATAAIATTTIWACSWNFQFCLGAVNLLNCCVLALGIISTGQDFPTGESAIKLPTYQSIQDEHKRMMDLPTPNSHFPRHSTPQTEETKICLQIHFFQDFSVLENDLFLNFYMENKIDK